jgi:hypothetical protein
VVKFLVIYPGIIISGHELMFKKHQLEFEKLSQITVVSRSNFSSRAQFFRKILSKRKKNKNVLLVNGSPYGHVALKIFLFLMGFRITEYCPFPELPEMADRFYHRFVPKLNSIIVHRRILIDDWQLKYSSVKNSWVIHNHV